MVIGVENRVHELADRSIEDVEKIKNKFIPYKNLVPLTEILADTFGCGVNTKKVKIQYDEMIEKLGNEFNILINSSLDSIENTTTKQIADAIGRVRTGNIYVEPGYDGEFGVVKVFKDGKNMNGSE